MARRHDLCGGHGLGRGQRCLRPANHGRSDSAVPNESVAVRRTSGADRTGTRKCDARDDSRPSACSRGGRREAGRATARSSSACGTSSTTISAADVRLAALAARLGYSVPAAAAVVGAGARAGVHRARLMVAWGTLVTQDTTNPIVTGCSWQSCCLGAAGGVLALYRLHGRFVTRGESGRRRLVAHAPDTFRLAAVLRGTGADGDAAGRDRMERLETARATRIRCRSANHDRA